VLIAAERFSRKIAASPAIHGHKKSGDRLKPIAAFAPSLAQESFPMGYG
jgi:hypothetical protein